MPIFMTKEFESISNEQKNLKEQIASMGLPLP